MNKNNFPLKEIVSFSTDSVKNIHFYILILEILIHLL